MKLDNYMIKEEAIIEELNVQSTGLVKIDMSLILNSAPMPLPFSTTLTATGSLIKT